MLKNTVVDRFNINLVDYTSYFVEDRCVDIVDELYEYGITIDSVSVFQRDIARAISHHIFSSVCEYIIKYRDNTECPVMYIFPEQLDLSELTGYLISRTISEYVTSHFRLIESLLGIKHVISNVNFQEFTKLINIRDGDTLETLSNLKYSRSYNLYKMKQHVERHGLTQLKHEFFNNQRFKQVLI